MIKQITFLSKEDKKVLELCKKYKISVSSIKIDKGFEINAPQVLTNIKIGSKKAGEAYDMGRGGNLLIREDKIIKILEKIKKESPQFMFYGEKLNYSSDMIIELLQEDYEYKKLCKKKTIVVVTKESWTEYVESNKKGEEPKRKEYEIKIEYQDKEQIDKFIISRFKEYSNIEIINKRFL